MRRLVLLLLVACGDDTSVEVDAAVEIDARIDGDAAIAVDASLDAEPVCEAPVCACDLSPPAGVAQVTGLPDELSGLALSRTVPGLLWTHADSNAGPIVYALGSNGVAGGSLRLTGTTAVDWEDITSGGTSLFVGDIGDNDLVRPMVTIYEVTEPATRPSGQVDVTPTRFNITYPDGPHNTEALVFDHRDSATYIVTKVTSGPASVYAMPRTAGVTAVATKLGELTIPTGSDRRITAADLVVTPCCISLWIRTRDRLFSQTAPADTSIAQLITAPLIERPVADEPQGEAVVLSLDGAELFTISEGNNPTLYRSTCE
jgi:hypothetical protein